MDSQKSNSVFRTTAKAFFGSLFGILGAFVGIIVVVIIFAILNMGGHDDGPEIKGRYNVIPTTHDMRSKIKGDKPLILYLSLHGPIGPSREMINVDSVREQLERSRQKSFKDGRIKAIFISMNSPGGSAFASDTIYRLIKQYREEYKVPVYVYVDGLCASGGMYISCAADKIFASQVSIIGSVGVRSSYFSVYETLNKLGVKSLTLTAGKDKAPLNPFSEWKEGEDEQAKLLIAAFYDRFVDVVLKARPKMTRKELVDDYGARVFPAPEAMEKGYIDGVVESQNQAIAMLAEAADLDEYQVIQLEAKSWVESLFGAESPLFSGRLSHQVGMPQEEPANSVQY